jgi:hypothetical protein
MVVHWDRLTTRPRRADTMRRISRILAIAIALDPSLAAAALFKCIAADGHVTYRDTPCASANRSATVDLQPPAGADAGLRPGERDMLERAYRRDEREAAQAARAARDAPAERRIGKLQRRKDEIARELGSSIGGKTERSALVDERRSIEREMATLRPRR